jgi:N6-adenosine-specific RNA methylase IME4
MEIHAMKFDLTQYNATIRSLATLTHFPDVKKIRDQAVAVQAYAVQAKDNRIIGPATEIRVEAETRAGELLLDMGRDGRRKGDGQPKKERSHGATVLPKLSDLRVSKTQSSRWQKLAVMRRDAPKKWQKRLERLTRMAVASAEGDREVVRQSRMASRLERMKKRNDIERALAKKIKALPTKKYAVIYADPEWKFKTWDGLSGGGEHYNVSELEIIKQRDVGSISAKDSVLFLWAIQPMLPHALEVMRAWGFNYVSHCIWNKDKTGTGYWFINKHEILLVGTRGDIPAPLPGTQWHSVIDAPRGKHSEKPKKFAEMIEQYFPLLPKIELNCRGKPRSGWDAWGAEALEAAE